MTIPNDTENTESFDPSAHGKSFGHWVVVLQDSTSEASNKRHEEVAKWEASDDIGFFKIFETPHSNDLCKKKNQQTIRFPVVFNACHPCSQAQFGKYLHASLGGGWGDENSRKMIYGWFLSYSQRSRKSFWMGCFFSGSRREIHESKRPWTTWAWTQKSPFWVVRSRFRKNTKTPWWNSESHQNADECRWRIFVAYVCFAVIGSRLFDARESVWKKI